MSKETPIHTDKNNYKNTAATESTEKYENKITNN